MSVLDREALEASPLADLHAIASELSIDGYRRLRREALIDAILGTEGVADERPAQDGPQAPEPAAEEREDGAPTRRRRGRRAGRGRTGAPGPERGDEQDRSEEAAEEEPARGRSVAEEATPEAEEPGPAAEEPTPAAQEATAAAEEATAAAEEAAAAAQEQIVDGVVELLPNGSGFVRVQPPEPSDHDVYISAAQVKRCELVSGDRVSGPRRAPRRSERFASMVRIDTINDRPADEVTDSARFDDLPAAFAQERFRLGSEDPTLKAIEWLTPFGRGSRVTIVGASGAGKSEALRRLAQALADQEDVQVSVALAGVRPEEIFEWGSGSPAPAAATDLGASPDTQDHSVELVVDQARRIAARGAHAVVLIDSLDGLHPYAARKTMSAARNIVDGGSLTVIATSSKAIGGETTIIALDRTLTSTGRFPALDLVASGTLRPELLVGDAGAEAIARARAQALE